MYLICRLFFLARVAAFIRNSARSGTRSCKTTVRKRTRLDVDKVENRGKNVKNRKYERDVPVDVNRVISRNKSAQNFCENFFYK